MPTWQGNSNNPSPNNKREAINRSEKLSGDNRALHTRRDTDNQRNFTIGFYDIDETILNHLKNINLQVTDNGSLITVPVIYGSPEIWVSVRRDGYLRDKQGKVILPLVAFKRTSSARDSSLKYFNRYLNAPVIQRYSIKNKYTKFSILNGKNVPVNEVYNLTFPSHMEMTYHFIIWTEYVEQMNKIIENIQFNTNDYWGTKSGFKFRTKIESFSHTTELQVGEDRIVKTEFDLITHGYILPDTITKLEEQKLTMDKFLTPKKIIIYPEVVTSDYEFASSVDVSEKLRNLEYPNLPRSEQIPKPNPSVVSDGNISDESNIVN